MEAVEIVVFFLAAVVIGSLIIMFVANLDIKTLYENISNVFFPPPLDQNALLIVSKARFIGVLGECWQQCGFGSTDTDCVTVNITDKEGAITQEEIKSTLEKYNYCTDCNVLVQGEPIELPNIVKVSCREAKIIIES